MIQRTLLGGVKGATCDGPDCTNAIEFSQPRAFSAAEGFAARLGQRWAFMTNDTALCGACRGVS